MSTEHMEWMEKNDALPNENWRKGNGNGKGDHRRPEALQNYVENYDKIDWSK